MRAVSRTSTADYTLREFLLQGSKSNFSESRRIYHYHFQVMYLITNEISVYIYINIYNIYGEYMREMFLRPPVIW